MSRTWWKNREREASKIIGGRRYPANTGSAIDCESDSYCVQVKERGALSLTKLETLAVEIERVASQKPIPKLGLVMVKRSAGRGVKTPWLIVMTEGVFREMTGRLPTDPVP